LQGAATGRAGVVDVIGVCGRDGQECGVVGVVERVGGAVVYISASGEGVV
jgi:hypothetical protein